jgi:uncharacterized RDD family membrane protein YckC
MAVISITTTQNIELEYDLASLGERMVAAIIDIVILAGYIILIQLFGTFSGGLFNSDIGWITFFIIMLPVTFYSLLSETYLNGQTVGKKVMGIKVISLSGNQPAFSQYLIRWLFRLVDLWSSGFVLAIVMIAATEKHQRLGDLVAGTTLVKIKLRTAVHQTLYMPVADTNYVANYPEVTQLSDSDMQLVKEVLINVQKSGNPVLAMRTMNKIEDVLHIKSRHEDPVSFLYALLSDYNHLTSKM